MKRITTKNLLPELLKALNDLVEGRDEERDKLARELADLQEEMATAKAAYQRQQEHDREIEAEEKGIFDTILVWKNGKQVEVEAAEGTNLILYDGTYFAKHEYATLDKPFKPYPCEFRQVDVWHIDKSKRRS